MDLIEKNLEKIIDWSLSHGIKIIIILFLAFLLKKIADLFVIRLIDKLIIFDNFNNEEAKKKRKETLIRIFSLSSKILIFVIVGLMILQEFGVAIGPLLAAAGVAGLAFGFGGQYLIKDLISGLFIIMENQYRIGDIVSFNETTGTVEDITLRMTTLRDLDGVVHHVPHGEITKVSNFSKFFARVNLNIGVSYDTNLEHVISVINRVGDELSKDDNWREQIIKAPHFLRIDDFADSAIIIKILGETKPLKQWEVTGELRKRLKINFDKENIEIPFPQRVVHETNKKVNKQIF